MRRSRSRPFCGEAEMNMRLVGVGEDGVGGRVGAGRRKGKLGAFQCWAGCKRGGDEGSEAGGDVLCGGTRRTLCFS